MKETINYGFRLFLICFFASTFLAKIYSITKPKIEAMAKEEFQKNLKQLIVEADKFLPVNVNNETLFYKAFNKNDECIGFVFETSAKGYSSIINTLVALDKNGQIIEIKILNQNETPGLGSRITEEGFRGQFRKKKLDDIYKVQTISGATISSKAVINSVKERLEKIKEFLK